MGLRVAHGVAILAVVFYVAFGAWAFLSPRSFFDAIATFPPYNEHFLHDIGAFQVGLGAALLAALVLRSALVAALVGVAVASVLHAVAHAVDAQLGGQPTDVWVLGLFAALVLLAAVLAWRADTAAARR
jgi:hypothetical protein